MVLESSHTLKVVLCAAGLWEDKDRGKVSDMDASQTFMNAKLACTEKNNPNGSPNCFARHPHRR